jgi:hypothetical protein
LETREGDFSLYKVRISHFSLGIVSPDADGIPGPGFGKAQKCGRVKHQ